MLLNQIISANDTGTDAILIELLVPYKKSLFAYYTNYFISEPILMVVSVSNVAQYGIIVPIDEIHEALDTYIGSEEYNEDDKEVILFNSIPLKNL